MLATLYNILQNHFLGSLIQRPRVVLVDLVCFSGQQRQVSVQHIAFLDDRFRQHYTFQS